MEAWLCSASKPTGWNAGGGYPFGGMGNEDTSSVWMGLNRLYMMNGISLYVDVRSLRGCATSPRPCWNETEPLAIRLWILESLPDSSMSKQLSLFVIQTRKMNSKRLEKDWARVEYSCKGFGGRRIRRRASPDSPIIRAVSLAMRSARPAIGALGFSSSLSVTTILATRGLSSMSVKQGAKE